MKRFVSASALGLVALILTTAVSGEAPYVQRQDVVFAESDGVGVLMDIFTPTGKANGLGVVDVASGAWFSDRGKINDHKRAQMYDIFCGRGYTVFAVRPGSRSRFTAPEMLSHLKQGIRWVKAHNADYSIDPERLGLTGASAGGHLASLAAVTAEDGRPDDKNPLNRTNTRVKAVAVFFPPTDFTNWDGRKIEPGGEGRIAGTIGNLLFAGGINKQSSEEVFEQIKKISPALQVTSQAPPFLIYHGDADPLVPLQQSQVLIEALKKQGVPAELIVKPGGGHPWPTIHEEVAKVADWFDGQLPAK
ncbi:MAG: alpha/beta hydrolase [Planctomycetia bacterium]|nr:alpha/beta hydrolase [Planctomycetia bacterium]